MIKNIKRTKEMRLDELIKYVWDNDIKHKIYEDVNNMELEIRFSPYGYLDSTPQNVTPSDLFKVEVEEPITEDTVFDYLITVESNGSIYNEYKKSIGFILSKTSDVVQILVSVDGKYRTVWERE